MSRPVFCGSFDYETRQSDLDRLFSKYGRIQRVDMKNGFAFVYFDDEKDGDDAIKHLDNTTFGHTKRRLTVEWARGERGSRNHEGTKSVTNQRPTKTLFVINFDPNNTRSADIEKHFEPYGKVSNVRIRRNFAFVQFDTQEEATKALEATHMSEISGRVVSVEYALKDDSERGRDRHGSPRRSYGSRGSSPYGRSRSPVHRRIRASPGYGRRPSPDPYYGRPRSPAYGRPRSPAYGRPRSPAYGRPRSPAYGRPRSPAYGRPRSPAYGHPRSPAYGHPRSPAYGRPRSPDPVYGRGRSPAYDRYNAPAYNRKSSPGYDRYRSGSPLRR